MLISLAELRLKIDNLKKEYSTKLFALQGGATVSSIKELGGSNHEEVLSAPFDFEAELAQTDKIAKELALLNGILAKANNSTPISDEDTIQTAIAKLQEKRKLLDKVEYILSNSKEGKQRKADGGFGSNTAYYAVTSFNFKKPELIEFRDGLKNELNALEVKIGDANNNTKVEV